VVELTIGKPWQRTSTEPPHPDGYLDADIGPIALWNRAITEAEAVAYFNSGAGVDLLPGAGPTTTPTATPTPTEEPSATPTPDMTPVMARPAPARYNAGRQR
jgi:hypothetical protein